MALGEKIRALKLYISTSTHSQTKKTSLSTPIQTDLSSSVSHVAGSESLSTKDSGEEKEWKKMDMMRLEQELALQLARLV